MKKMWILPVVGLVGGLGIITSAWAVDQGAPAIAQKKIETGAATASSAQQPAAVQGSITGLNLQDAAPTIALKGNSGQSWNLAIDPKATTVWNGSQLGNISQLKLGEQVKVRYAEQNGRRIAKTIEIAPSQARATASGATQTQQ